MVPLSLRRVLSFAGRNGPAILCGGVLIGIAFPALASAADGYDVVLDYLWGEPAVRTLTALAGRGIDPGRPVRFVNVGSLAGSEIAVPASLLRSAALTLSGHGLGSSSTTEFPSAAAEIFTAAVAGQMHINVVTRPLSEVESAWDIAERLVLMP